MAGIGPESDAAVELSVLCQDEPVEAVDWCLNISRLLCGANYFLEEFRMQLLLMYDFAGDDLAVRQVQ